MVIKRPESIEFETVKVRLDKIKRKCLVCDKEIINEESSLADFPICVYCYKDMVKQTLMKSIKLAQFPESFIDGLVNEHIDFLIRANQWEINRLVEEMRKNKAENKGGNENEK
jgi:hypothetical protein